jgi:hypothetical protein
MGTIVDIQFARLAKLLEDRKITLVLDASARTWLADKGYDPAYGARPLKRVIQKFVQDQLAEKILAGSIKDGESVEISADKAGIVIGRDGGEFPEIGVSGGPGIQLVVIARKRSDEAIEPSSAGPDRFACARDDGPRPVPSDEVL